MKKNAETLLLVVLAACLLLVLQPQNYTGNNSYAGQVDDLQKDDTLSDPLEVREQNQSKYTVGYTTRFTVRSAPKIAICLAETQSWLGRALEEEISRVAAEAQLDLNIYDAGNDPVLQEQQIYACIRDRPNVLVVSPILPDQIQQAVIAVKKAHIPLININQPLDNKVLDLIDASIGVHSTETFSAKAEILAKYADSGGVLVLTREIENPQTEQEIRNFEYTIDSLPQFYSVSRATVRTADIEKEAADIAATLQKDIAVLYVMQSNLLPAVSLAFEQQEDYESVFIICHEHDYTAQKYLLEEKIHGLIVPDIKEVAQETLLSARSILNGRKPPFSTRICLTLITPQRLRIIQQQTQTGRN